MRKGQVGIGLVILGVVAIIAVIGLVLLFTKASKVQGALLTDLSIGNAYGGGTVPGMGIATTYPTPEYIRTAGGGGVPAYPETAYPAYAGYATSKSTYGERTPAWIISKITSEGRVGFASIEDAYGCETDLMLAGIPVPHDQYNFYTVPNKGGEPEVYGRYPQASSAEPRPLGGYIGKVGGDVYAFVNSVGSEQTMLSASNEDLNRDLILKKLVYGTVSQAKYKWGTAIVNGKTVAVCWVSEKTFPFPQ